MRSGDNPADCASRGLTPTKLVEFEMWWSGPGWLKRDEKQYPKNIAINEGNTVEAIISNSATIQSEKCKQTGSLPNVSSYYKMKRIMVHCIRFARKILGASNKHGRYYITMDEMREAEKLIVKTIQIKHVGEEMKLLERNQALHKKNALKQLSPFIDGEGIIRVGGRLYYAEIPYNARHQMILPNKGSVAELIIIEIHEKALHGGSRITEAMLRQKFWIVRGYKRVANTLKNCIICAKYRSSLMNKYMGNLPISRVQQQRPFMNCGVDYAGPINVRTSKGRGQKSYKGYLAIIVCLATKAIHIEVVSDGTAEAFLSAYRRFAGRRGAAANIYSDNGTNFVLANKLIQIESKAEEEEYNNTIYNEMLKVNTQWHFIPPSSPHFGSLWEAGENQH